MGAFYVIVLITSWSRDQLEDSCSTMHSYILHTCMHSYILHTCMHSYILHSTCSTMHSYILHTCMHSYILHSTCSTMHSYILHSTCSTMHSYILHTCMHRHQLSVVDFCKRLYYFLVCTFLKCSCSGPPLVPLVPNIVQCSQ